MKKLVLTALVASAMTFAVGCGTPPPAKTDSTTETTPAVTVEATPVATPAAEATAPTEPPAAAPAETPAPAPAETPAPANP